MNNFTPGPWIRDGRTVYALNAKNFNRFYFSVMDSHTPESELLAVAALAQAAPDLLEALELILETRIQEKGAWNWKPGESPLHDRCHAAIAKAKGEA